MEDTADSLARSLAKEAIGVMAEEMRNPLNEAKDRLKAAEMLLDRGHGKAAQAIIAIPASRRMTAAAAQLTEEQLLEVMRATPLPQLAAPHIDAEFSVVEPETDPLLL